MDESWKLKKRLKLWGCVCCLFDEEDIEYGTASIRIEDDLVFYELLFNDGIINQEIQT